MDDIVIKRLILEILREVFTKEKVSEICTVKGLLWRNKIFGFNQWCEIMSFIFKITDFGSMYRMLYRVNSLELEKEDKNLRQPFKQGWYKW